jgi:hypothetical protein
MSKDAGSQLLVFDGYIGKDFPHHDTKKNIARIP